MNNAELDLTEFDYFANKLLDDARRLCLQLKEAAQNAETKHDHTLVTLADKEIEGYMRSQIEVHFPTHAIMGEEQADKQTSDNFCWVIDPIDGTKAFAAGLPTYTILLGLLYKDETIAGWVDQPDLQKRWTSEQGTPQAQTYAAPIIASTSLDFMSAAQYEKFQNWRKAQGLQFLPTGDAYAYMMLLEGRIIAAFDIALKPYDILPLLPILAQDETIHTKLIETNGHINFFASRDVGVLEALISIFK